MGETVRANPNAWKYDTSVAKEFYPKGFWADGSYISNSEVDEACTGGNENAAKYLMAGGDPIMTQKTFDEKYMSEEDFIAKYGYSNKW